MRVLVVERSSEGQAILARRLECMDRVDKDSLDLTVSLASEQDFLEKVRSVDVVILGPSLAENSSLFVRKIKLVSKIAEILILVPEADYSRAAFRSALALGARRVLPANAPLLDFVQELTSIFEEFRACGKVRSGNVVALLQAKGGIGVTSTCAALAEVCSDFGQRTMLWDLDIETRDLCRALSVEGDQPSIVRSWIEGTEEVSRDSLRAALMRASPLVSVLPPPDQIAASVDLVGRVEIIDLAQAIINLGRVTHDNVIIDLSGRVGPAAGAILRNADSVVVMLDDSVLGVSAVRFFLSTLRSIVKNLEFVSFLCSGTSTSKQQLADHIEGEISFSPEAWRLPVIPFDPSAARWPGTGKTLYSLGKRSTKKVFEKIASELQLIPSEAHKQKPVLLLPFLGPEGREAQSTRTSEEPTRSFWTKVANAFE